MSNQRVSQATYLSARQSLLSKARSYRQWMKSDPSRHDHWFGWLKNQQRHMMQLRQAERIPAPWGMPL